MSEFQTDDKVVLWKLFEAIKGHFFDARGESRLHFDEIKPVGQKKKVSVIEITIPGSSCAATLKKILEDARDGVEDEAK